MRDAVSASKTWRDHIARSVPEWPLGLPDWDAPELALALLDDDHGLLVLWSRSLAAAEIEVPWSGSSFEPVFPLPEHGLPAWTVQEGHGSTTLVAPPGLTGAAFSFRRG